PAAWVLLRSKRAPARAALSPLAPGLAAAGLLLSVGIWQRASFDAYLGPGTQGRFEGGPGIAIPSGERPPKTAIREGGAGGPRLGGRGLGGAGGGPPAGGPGAGPPARRLRAGGGGGAGGGRRRARRAGPAAARRRREPPPRRDDPRAGAAARAPPAR